MKLHWGLMYLHVRVNKPVCDSLPWAEMLCMARNPPALFQTIAARGGADLPVYLELARKVGCFSNIEDLGPKDLNRGWAESWLSVFSLLCPLACLVRAGSWRLSPQCWAMPRACLAVAHGTLYLCATWVTDYTLLSL